ncbi:MAG: condensation domain-containing protein, partial [Ginsengibacter sp.]
MKYNQFNKTAGARTGKGILDLLTKKETSFSDIDKEIVSHEITALANIWKDLLGRSDFKSSDDFFQVGGNSLKAVQLVSRVSHQLSVNIDLADIFSHPTLTQQSDIIQERKNAKFLSPSIVKSPRPENIPLSYSQERVWFIDQLEGSVPYNIGTAFRLRGVLNVEALALSFGEIVSRHEVLRTVFTEIDGIPSQYFKKEGSWKLQVEKWESNENDLREYISSLIKSPFNLAQDDMLRATLLVLGEEEHLLVVTMHHIASDGWSVGLIVKEIASLYQSYSEDKPITLQPLELQYADYAIWQRSYLQGEVLNNKIKYWKEKLEGVAPLELPLDY